MAKKILQLRHETFGLGRVLAAGITAEETLVFDMKFEDERTVLIDSEFWESTAEQLKEVFNAAPIRKRVEARRTQIETVSNQLDESIEELDEPEEIEPGDVQELCLVMKNQGT